MNKRASVALLCSAVMITGVAVSPIGVVVALIGGVVWEAGISRRAKANRLLSQFSSDIQPTDPNHERRMARTVRMRQPRAQVFSYQFQF